MSIGGLVMLLSIVIPCYNEESTIDIYYDEFQKVVFSDNIDVELIFVDDGSFDNTLLVLKRLSLSDKRVKYISFSRNFGKESAMLAGFRAAKGDYVAVMDVDLQDPPCVLSEMYDVIKVGSCERVAAKRNDRKGESFFKSFLSKSFYKVMNWFSDVKVEPDARDYSMMTRKFVDSLLLMSEKSRFTKGLFSWVGYKTAWVTFDNHERSAGESKWPLRKLFLYSVDGIVSFSAKPLQLVSLIGLFLCGLSLFFILFIIFRTLVFGDPVAGWPSMVCIILFIAGLQQFSMGIVGSYILRIFTEVKGRPDYFISESNLDDH